MKEHGMKGDSSSRQEDQKKMPAYILNYLTPIWTCFIDPLCSKVRRRREVNKGV